MTYIFYLMGKSSSGKDTIYKRVTELSRGELKTIVGYTTRPMRDGETDGSEYFFVSREKYEAMCKKGIVIESRDYHTVHGLWTYFTADDGQIELEKYNYLLIGTLESYEKIRKYYGEEKLIPLYIEVEDGERLTRALEREKKQKTPKYAELCRRFLADSEDFSEERLKACGITERYRNDDLDGCIDKLCAVIREKTVQV